MRTRLIPGLDQHHKEISWIGLNWNFEHSGISVIGCRIEKFKENLRAIKLLWPGVTYRDIFSLIGLLNSMYPAFNGREQFMSRFLQTWVYIRHV